MPTHAQARMPVQQTYKFHDMDNDTFNPDIFRHLRHLERLVQHHQQSQ